MKSRTVLTLVSAACLTASLGWMLADTPVARAAGVSGLRFPRDPQNRPLPAPQAYPQTAQERQAFLRKVQPMVASGTVGRKLAELLGIPNGSRPAFPRGKAAQGGVRLSFETPVATDYLGMENTPSIAASPIDERVVVAVAQDDTSGNGECQVYVSFDGGLSYASEFPLPLQNPGDFCADPVVRATPHYVGGASPIADLSFFVITYLSERTLASTPPRDLQSDGMIVVLDGVDPTANPAPTPVVVAPSTLGLVDKGWVGVHSFDYADGTADGYNFIYYTATAFTPTSPTAYDCSIIFSRSTDTGQTWSAPATLASSTGCTQPFEGPRVAAAPGQQVLVCYFDAGLDGLNIEATTGGKFNIRCNSSKDRGVSFSPTSILASKDVVYELPRQLCPGLAGGSGNDNFYHEVWQSMFPSVEIDHTGNAHVVFAADPSTSKADAECGNIFYVKSIYPNGSVPTAPAYDKWIARAAIGTGGRAQVFPTVVAQRTLSQVKPIVYVAYADHSRGDTTKPNLAYDVKYRRSIVGGGAFQAPVLVTSQSSLSQYSFIGDYFDSSATSRRYHIIWTDRGDKTDKMDYESDVFTRWY